MSETKEDLVFKYLQFGEEFWLARILGGPGIEIEKSYFEGNPDFSEAAQSIISIGTVTHFNHVIPNIDDENDEVDDGDDLHSKLAFGYNIYFNGVKAHEPFVTIEGDTGFLIITPVRYWSYLDGNYSSGETDKIKVEDFNYEIALELPNANDEIIGETWRHATKSGGRDYRYIDNGEVYLVRRYGVTLRIQNKQKWEFGNLFENSNRRTFSCICCASRS